VRRFLIPTVIAAMAMPVGIQAAGGAVIRGTEGPDRLNGTARADELYGRAGNDRLEGRGAGDLIDGGGGRDRLSGSAGNDRLASQGDGRIDAVLCGTGRDIANADLNDLVTADCEVVSRQLSRDAGQGDEAQHETQVEPDSFAYGSTIVTVFQSGRYTDGGAANIGFATSRNGGRAWTSGVLPGLSVFSTPPGQSFAVTDPSIAYDALHNSWLAASLGGSFGVSELFVNRSRDGVTWSLPVSAARSALDEYDKEWIVCDNWPTSPLRGRCYLSYMNFATELLETRHSTDGGRTWSAPATVNAHRPAAVVNGAQPVVRPNGELVIIFAVFGAIRRSSAEIAAVRSIDGGETFTQPTRVAPLEEVELSGTRAPPFPSVEVDGLGTIYVAWSDCRFSDQCGADIVLARSRDGITWTEPTRIPLGVPDASIDRFLPGLAVDPASSGRKTRIAVLYHSLGPGTDCDPIYVCLVVDVGLIVTRDGGSTWTRPQRLNAASMPLQWIAQTSLGRMLGDYVSASWVKGRPVPVFALASEPSGELFHQAIFATTRALTSAAAARR
jgi:hypothetical protein